MASEKKGKTEISFRPDPDQLVQALKQDGIEKQKANLRIFLGMSAGVGKTYAMLQAAHRQIETGVDVVVGIVETHGRVETAALLTGLPVIPLKKVEYRGTVFHELDLDEILKRRPQLVVVDELAHLNVAGGSRHQKRYQDVLEILDAGINVCTALNVQHLESRKDSVEAITNVTIRETVPDSLLERAQLVELVDIAPSELLLRLQNGKIYAGEKAARAVENFFKEDRLTALREIALRITAERVDQDLQRMIPFNGAQSPWQTNERLLVGVSHSPYSEKLIRATRRLAYNLEAPWVAVYVDTGLALNDADQAQLFKNLNLARELNAEILTTTDSDIALALQRICRAKNVTQVIVGRPTKRWLQDFFQGGTLLDRLVRQNSEVDVHVIRQDGVTSFRSRFFGFLEKYKSYTGTLKYWFVFCLVTAVAFMSGFLESLIGYRAVGFIFLLAVMGVGLFGSLGAVAFSALLSAIFWNFFFIPPKMTFAIGSADDLILCFSYFAVALITGLLTQRIRFNERLIRDREEKTNFLYELMQDIAGSSNKSEFLTKACSKVGSLLDAECAVILKSNDNLSAEDHLVFENAKSYGINLNEKDRAVADWCFKNRKNAGWSTDTLSQSKALYVPLAGYTETVGVFVFQPRKRVRRLDLEKENLLFSVTRHLGISIEQRYLSRRRAEVQRDIDSQKLQQTLLDSISHELRTPLTSMIATVQSLQKIPEPVDRSKIHRNYSPKFRSFLVFQKRYS